jgi:hypothetical protein
LHAKTRAKDQSIKRLEKRLEEAIERRGLEVDESLHKDLCATISHASSEVKEKYPPGSFQRIFWEQQERASRLKCSKSMRWEPAMIRFV